MRLLLDSHAFVWFVLGHSRCSSRARRAIEDADTDIFFSAVTAWEIATKVRAGKWPEAAGLLADCQSILTANQFEPLAITVEHGRVAGRLEGQHRDPFDRMLAAQAIVEDLHVVTADPALHDLGAKVIW